MPELTINSNPPNGEVSINGAIIGIAPVTVTIGNGEQPEPPSYTLAFIESFDTIGPPSMSLDFTETFDE